MAAWSPLCPELDTLDGGLELRYTRVMTSTEYQQLVEFLGGQFTEIDRRFGQVDRRSDELDLRFTELRHDLLGHFDEIYRQVTAHFPVRGNLVPDAHLAALLRQHGVRRLYTVDRDFRKFDFLQVDDPFA